MSDLQTIDLNHLKAVLNRGLDEIMEMQGASAQVPTGYYWSLALLDALAPDLDPATATLASLDDDATEVTDLAGDPDKYVGFHGLAHARGLLLAMEHLLG